MRFAGALLSVVAAMLLAGCGQESDSRWTASEPAGAPPRAALEQKEAADEAAGEDAAVDPPAGVDRKIIYVADVSLVVDDFAETQREIPKLVQRYDGYLAEAVVNRTEGVHPSGRWTARIPVQSYQAFLDALEQLGIPERRNQTAQDVTEEYVDLEARASNKKRLEERILDLLAKREGKIEDILEVERELSRVREEIERMEGRMRYLQNRVALTTVSISAREERDYVPPQAPSLAGRIQRAWSGSLLALRRAGEAIIIAVVAAAPWALPVLLLIVPLRWTWKRWRQ